MEIIEVTEVSVEVAKIELDGARAALERARAEYAAAQDTLREAILAVTPRTAEDYRVRIVQDDGHCFTSEKDMLDQVFGDFYTDPETGELTECAQEYVEAWTNGRGIYAWGGALEARDPVTDEWLEVDSCFGFYSTNDCAPEDDIVDAVGRVAESVDVKDIEIVYGDA